MTSAIIFLCWAGLSAAWWTYVFRRPEKPELDDLEREPLFTPWRPNEPIERIKFRAGASTPMMITQAMRARLHLLGLADVQIDGMTPDEAWRILRELDPMPGDPPVKAKEPEVDLFTSEGQNAIMGHCGDEGPVDDAPPGSVRIGPSGTWVRVVPAPQAPPPTSEPVFSGPPVAPHILADRIGKGFAWSVWSTQRFAKENPYPPHIYRVFGVQQHQQGQGFAEPLKLPDTSLFVGGDIAGFHWFAIRAIRYRILGGSPRDVRYCAENMVMVTEHGPWLCVNIAPLHAFWHPDADTIHDGTWVFPAACTPVIPPHASFAVQLQTETSHIFDEETRVQVHLLGERDIGEKAKPINGLGYFRDLS